MGTMVRDRWMVVKLFARESSCCWTRALHMAGDGPDAGLVVDAGACQGNDRICVLNEQGIPFARDITRQIERHGGMREVPRMLVADVNDHLRLVAALVALAGEERFPGRKLADERSSRVGHDLARARSPRPSGVGRRLELECRVRTAVGCFTTRGAMIVPPTTARAEPAQSAYQSASSQSRPTGICVHSSIAP